MLPEILLGIFCSNSKVHTLLATCQWQDLQQSLYGYMALRKPILYVLSMIKQLYY